MQHAHAIPEAATRDESKLVDAAQSSRGDTKTPLSTAIIDSPGPPLQAHTTPAPAGDTDTLHAHDTALVHGTQIDDNSDPSIRHDGIVDSNSVVNNNKSVTDIPFPVISSADYKTDAEFSGMFLYLHDGTLSGNVKKDQPILIMEDNYIIDEDGLYTGLTSHARRTWPH